MSSNVSFLNSTTERYALALYEISKENSELDKVEKEANSLKELIKNNSDFKNMIVNPIIEKEKKSEILLKISNTFEFTKTFKNFLGLLSSKRRLFFLTKIIDNFLRLVSKNKGEIEAKLISSKKLKIEDIELIQKDLSKYLNSKIKIKYEYDENLLGGFIIQVGSIMIDTTIKNKLKSLKNKMMEI